MELKKTVLQGILLKNVSLRYKGMSRDVHVHDW